ncbi:MAG: C39 family peptidase [Proteobacteria bacterium]|nr:C39 family peptidase [Pseudomonadota bacterium]
MRLFLLAALVAAGACHAQQAPAPRISISTLDGSNVAMPVVSIKHARVATTLQQQYDFSCGSAALATLLTYQYDYPVTERAVFDEMFAYGDKAKIEREGFSLLDMKRYLADHGFDADGFNQPLNKLLEARLPAIVLINQHGYHHFVVIKGLDAQRVLIGDPASGTRAMARSEFEKIWEGHLLFVIHNRMDKARFNLAIDWHAAPRGPLDMGVNRTGLTGGGLTKLGPGDF